VCHRPSVSLNKEKVSREIRENKMTVCEKTQGLWSGNFTDLNSACSKVLVPVKIFQFYHIHYESERYRDAANGLYSKNRNREKRLCNKVTQEAIESVYVQETLKQ
jgi:hypothetical protein